MNEVTNQDQYDRIYARDRGVCQTCGKPVSYGTGERAHRIAQSKRNLSRYSEAVIHHDANMALTCPGACNDAQNIGNRPVEAERLAGQIRQDIYATAICAIEDSPYLHRDILNKLGEVTR